MHLTSGEYLGKQGAMKPLLDIFLGTVELAAGGRVTNGVGQELRFDRLSPLFEDGLYASNGAVHGALLARCAGVRA